MLGNCTQEIQNLSERQGTGKLRSYWEDGVGVIVESKGKENLAYAVIPETKINGKIGTLHGNLLLPCESIFKEPEGLHLIQKNKNSSTSSKKGQAGEHEKNSQDSDCAYSESDEEEGYTQR